MHVVLVKLGGDESLFDKNLDKKIRGIWKELEYKGISKYARELEDRVSHITIASYGKLSIENYIKKLQGFYEDIHSIPITLQTIGTFLKYLVLYPDFYKRINYVSSEF